MRIAICENTPASAEQLRIWVEQYCACYRMAAVLHCFTSAESFADWKGSFDIVFLGFGGTTGFLQARLLRERDRECRIIMIDDTQEFAVRCVRLRCTDFILRPVTFRRVIQSMCRATQAGVP